MIGHFIWVSVLIYIVYNFFKGLFPKIIKRFARTRVLRGQVVKKTINGYANPANGRLIRHLTDYILTFEQEDKTKTKIICSEEVYDHFPYDQLGTLTYKWRYFMKFVPDKK